MKTLRIILVTLIAFFAVTLVACSNSSDSGNEVTGGGITEPSKNDKTEDKLSTECELTRFGLYVKTEPENKYSTEGFSFFEGTFSENNIQITLPSDFKESTYYLYGEMSAKSTTDWDGVEKQFNSYLTTNNWPLYSTEEYQIAFEDGKTSYEIIVTAEDGKTKKTYTVNVEWKFLVSYNLNGASGTTPETTAFSEGEEITIKGIGSASKKTSGGNASVFLGWTDGKGNKYQPDEKITIENSSLFLTAKWSEYGVGDKITGNFFGGVTDVFDKKIGNPINGYECYVVYVRTADEYSTTCTDGTDELTVTYPVVDADGKEWRYLITYSVVFDGGPWSENTASSISDTGLNIGDGKSNFDKIIATLGNNTACLSAGLYKDYKMYIPSVGELHVILDAMTKKANLSSSDIYWTSTQTDDAGYMMALCPPSYISKTRVGSIKKSANANNLKTFAITYLPEED